MAMGMPLRCSRACLTNWESLSAWAMKRVTAVDMGKGAGRLELNSSWLRESGWCTSR